MGSIPAICSKNTHDKNLKNNKTALHRTIWCDTEELFSSHGHQIILHRQAWESGICFQLTLPHSTSGRATCQSKQQERPLVLLREGLGHHRGGAVSVVILLKTCLQGALADAALGLAVRERHRVGPSRQHGARVGGTVVVRTLGVRGVVQGLWRVVKNTIKTVVSGTQISNEKLNCVN